MPIIIETRDEFIARHGEFVHLDPNVYGSNRLLFQDGATWLYGVANEHGTEPPTDPTGLQKSHHLFVSTKLATAKKQLDNVRAAVRLQAQIHGSGHGPHPDTQFPLWRDHIQQMTQHVENLQREVDSLASELPRNRRLVEHELQRASQRQAAAEVLRELDYQSHHQERKTDVRN